MAMQIGALPEALLNPGDVLLANKAAEDVAGHDRELGSLRSDISRGSVLATILKLFMK